MSGRVNPRTGTGRPYGRGPYGRGPYSTYQALALTPATAVLALTATLSDALWTQPPRWQPLQPCVQGAWMELLPS